MKNQNIVLSQIAISDLVDLIAGEVFTRITANKPSVEDKSHEQFRYLPIQQIFEKKICSKPTLYQHVKKGRIVLYKLGGRSYVDRKQFERAFRKVEI